MPDSPTVVRRHAFTPAPSLDDTSALQYRQWLPADACMGAGFGQRVEHCTACNISFDFKLSYFERVPGHLVDLPTHLALTSHDVKQR